MSLVTIMVTITTGTIAGTIAGTTTTIIIDLESETQFRN